MQAPDDLREELLPAFAPQPDDAAGDAAAAFEQQELNGGFRSTLRRVRASKVADDAGRMIVLQTLGRAVSFFASAFAMHRMGPEKLGVSAFALSVVAFGSVAADCGLNIEGVRAVSNEPERREAIVAAVCGIRLRAAILLSLLMLGWAAVVHPAGSPALWLMAAAQLVMLALTPQWIFQGLEKLPAFNALQVGQMTLTAGLYIALFRAQATPERYVFVALVTQTLLVLVSYRMLAQWVRVRWTGFDAGLARRLSKASGYAFAIVVTVYAYTGLEIPLITHFLAPEQAGVYRAALGIVGAMIPILAIPPLLIYPRLIAWKNDSAARFLRNARRVMGLLTAAGLGMALSAFVWVPMLFQHLLGAKFNAGILPCELLICAKGCVLIGSIPAWGLHAYDLDRLYLRITLLTACVSLGLNALLIPHFGILAAGAVNIVSETLIMSLSARVLFRAVKQSQRTQNAA